MDYTPTTLRICVDQMKTLEGDVKGRIYGVAVEEEATFADSVELFVLIDKLLDGIGKPQASRKTRSFRQEEESGHIAYCSSPKIYHTSDEIRKKEGRMFTRDVDFLSRFRSSWQGIIRDKNGKMAGRFESELEFIHLLYDCGMTSDAYNNN